MPPKPTPDEPLAVALPERRLVFFLIPKAATVSIRKAIGAARGIPWRRLPGATPSQIEHFRRVAFVRHPFTRLASCWKHWVRDAHHHRMAVHGITADMPFPAFVRRVAEIPDEAADVHFASQVSLIREPHYIGRVERLERDWGELSGLTDGLPAIGHFHAREGTVDYDDETARLAIGRYRADMEAFGYEVQIRG